MLDSPYQRPARRRIAKHMHGKHAGLIASLLPWKRNRPSQLPHCSEQMYVLQVLSAPLTSSPRTIHPLLFSVLSGRASAQVITQGQAGAGLGFSALADVQQPRLRHDPGLVTLPRL